jgi:hypothetical protein
MAERVEEFVVGPDLRQVLRLVAHFVEVDC